MSAEHPRGNARVSLTGYATASAWAHYGFENAAWFDSRRGRALFRPLHASCRALRHVAPGPACFTDTLYWRHRWFSAWLVATAPGMAIEIAAGLATRGVAYARRHPETCWVDYDLPGMIATRRRWAEHRPLPVNYSLRIGDLLDPTLGAELRTPARGPVCVLTEGVIDYLSMAEKQRAFTNIAGLLRGLGGGRYLFEIYPRNRLAIFGAPGRVLLAVLKRISGRDLTDQLFATPEGALELLKDCGFTQARVLDDTDLADAEDAPPERYRAFTLIEAQI